MPVSSRQAWDEGRHGAFDDTFGIKTNVWICLEFLTVGVERKVEGKVPYISSPKITAAFVPSTKSVHSLHWLWELGISYLSS